MTDTTHAEALAALQAEAAALKARAAQLGDEVAAQTTQLGGDAGAVREDMAGLIYGRAEAEAQPKGLVAQAIEVAALWQQVQRLLAAAEVDAWRGAVGRLEDLLRRVAEREAITAAIRNLEG